MKKVLRWTQKDQPKKKFWDERKAKQHFVVFYLIGALGFLLPFSFPWFVGLILPALVWSTLGLFAFHRPQSIPKDVLVFALIALAGFWIEAVGVNTGLIFGRYHYGEALGFQCWNTPLFIGINWVFVTYTGVAVSEQITRKRSLQLLIAPTLMVVYDLVLEQVAPVMDMWRWETASVPMLNYISWWLIGLVFVLIIKALRVNTRNPLALTLWGCQLLLFGIILLAKYTLQ